MVADSRLSDDESFSIDCPVLVTARLVLRAPHVDDVPDLARLANDRGVADMLGRMPHPYGEAEAAAFVASSADAGEARYALTDAETGAFIGCAGLNPVGGALDLGYWIGRPHWGKGYATEAAQALVDLAFRASNTDHLTVSCRVTNAASRRVIHKCGFQYAGQGMMNSLAAGQVTVERYRLDRKTWVGLKSWGGDRGTRG
ncbi:MAG: GNAT family N-acetyltransferase [Mesorhizobium sp.]